MVKRWRFLAVLMGATCTLSAQKVEANEINLARKVKVIVSSSRGAKFAAENIIDGVVSDKSRWITSQSDKKPWVELTLPKSTTIGMVDLFSGYGFKDTNAIEQCELSVFVNGSWKTDPTWNIRGNKKSAVRIYIDKENVTKIRISNIKPQSARIREIAAYDNKEALGLDDVKDNPTKKVNIDFNQHQIAVNQIGYFLNRSKRFTAPLTQDGITFTIKEKGGSKVLFRGKVENNIGDFSEFRPTASNKRYVIEIKGGKLKDGVSPAFLISKNLDQEQFWQTAVDFLNDTRSVLGTHPSAYGGTAWRDGTYYDAIVPALVTFYLSDTKFIDAMPRQIDWEKEKARVTAPDFKYIAQPGSGGVMESVKGYFKLVPPKADAPDVVKMIHWGVGYKLMRPAGIDPSSKNKKKRIESQTVEQMSYMLWAWPVLKKWLPQSLYDQTLEFCLQNWDKSLNIDKRWDPSSYSTVENWKGQNMHPMKGRCAPGHSIVPNLMMYEVAQREGKSDADKYMKAAVEQTEFIIKNLDWNNPLTTKGHRMSEHRTIPNLVWFLQKYPKQAPKGLKKKIIEWAEVAVSRADNMWEFRKFSDELWTIPGLNEAGNTIGLPGIYIAASWVVDDVELKERLVELAFSSIDTLFGRNPMLASSTPHPKQGFPEAEIGWPKHYKSNVCARLETVRGNIATLPGSEMYPFSPGTAFRHPEGWVNYGAGWCISLSYIKNDARQTTPDMK